MFDMDRFIDDCAAAVKADPTHKTVRPIVERVVSDPTALLNTIGEPVAAGVNKICHRPDLTILNLVWGKRMTLTYTALNKLAKRVAVIVLGEGKKGILADLAAHPTGADAKRYPITGVENLEWYADQAAL